METKSLMKNGKMKTPDVYEGMHISMLLLRMPKELWVQKPTINREKGTDHLIIVYHYENYDIQLEWAESFQDGKLYMQGYFVQKIWEVENVDQS